MKRLGSYRNKAREFIDTVADPECSFFLGRGALRQKKQAPNCMAFGLFLFSIIIFSSLGSFWMFTSKTVLVRKLHFYLYE